MSVPTPWFQVLVLTVNYDPAALSGIVFRDFLSSQRRRHGEVYEKSTRMTPGWPLQSNRKAPAHGEAANSDL